MKNKLCQNKGETLVETLFALVIAVLSIGLITAAVTTSANVTKKIRVIDEKYKNDLQIVECYEGSTQSKVLTVTFYDTYGMPIGDSAEKFVDVYGEADSAFISYDYEPGGSGS